MCGDPFMLSNQTAAYKLVSLKEAKRLARNMTVKA